MTREEALNTLMKMRAWRAWGKEQKEEERPEMPEQKEVDAAFDVCIEMLSQPSLPSNLDEAAEEYALDVKAKPYGNLVKEAFKDGVKWRDARIPKLPENLDEAAEEYRDTEVCTGSDYIDDDGDSLYRSFALKDAFKAGVEWQLNEDSEKHYFIQLKNIKDAWQELKKSNPEIKSKSAVCFFKGAEWMAGQFQKIDGSLVDWYETNGVEYCHGISTNESFEVPEGFYIRKK